MPRRALAIGATALVAGVSLVPLFWNPWSAKWVSYKAYKAHVAGDYDAAIASYRRSMALGADRLWALENLAFAYHSKHADKECAATLDEIRARDARAAATIEAEILEASNKGRARPR